MQNWQYDYAIRLLQAGRESIEKEKQEIENSIEMQDKRTYNGKMFCIFAKAKLYVVEKLLQI